MSRSTALSEAAFKDVLSHFPAGVAIVTAVGDDGRPAGLTVTAFCSVSLTPPLVLVSIDESSATLRAVEQSQRLTINFLAAGRDSIAVRFASKRPDKFAGLPHRWPAIDGAGPILTVDAATYLVCALHQSVPAGDHRVLIAEVLDAGVEQRALLLFHRREFSAVG